MYSCYPRLINRPTFLGNFLHLYFASSQIQVGGVSAFNPKKNLDVSSDHLPILIKTPCRARNLPSIPRSHFSIIHPETFVLLLHTYMITIALLSGKSRLTLDDRVEELTQVNFTALFIFLPYNWRLRQQYTSSFLILFK